MNVFQPVSSLEVIPLFVARFDPSFLIPLAKQLGPAFLIAVSALVIFTIGMMIFYLGRNRTVEQKRAYLVKQFNALCSGRYGEPDPNPDLESLPFKRWLIFAGTFLAIGTVFLTAVDLKTYWHLIPSVCLEFFGAYFLANGICYEKFLKEPGVVSRKMADTESSEEE